MRKVYLSIIVTITIVVIVTSYLPSVRATCVIGQNGATLCAGTSTQVKITKSHATNAGNPDVTITLGCALNDIRYGDYFNSCYQPLVLYVPLGTRVTWQNDDTWQHSVTYGNPWQELSTGYFFDSGIMQSGQSFSYQFKYPGVYPYYDTFNWWETGLVIVKK